MHLLLCLWALEVHSSVYASIRLYSPRETMGFTDFSFLVKKGRDMRRFPGHRKVFLYLKDFCDWFRLREMIKFNTRVEYVGMIDSLMSGNDIKWIVRSKYMRSEKVMEEEFDAVVVASGHYSWKGKQIHSHIYRVPDPFRNKVVVIVGNSISGQDISLELVDVAMEIHLSAKSLEISEGLAKVISKYDNLHLHPQIESLCEGGRVQFVDGSWVIADSIIYCTGGIVVVDDNRVGPLYEHTFSPSLPPLSFVGIPNKVINFSTSHLKLVAQLLSGKRSLPSSINEFYHSKDVAGIHKHKTHDIANFKKAEANLETYRDSWDDHELLLFAHQSPHFIQLGPDAFDQ
ncbi:hypothetical protein NE237_020486 [Protea cynaroides]|uniref:Flavin-containing monooxygenase n=1 Tax=Protea cynaroides TaxID=273540 RepID=A0A9Q0H618_9MAGN|nr:hypothetical protein NE237_020486 [Protea cynaroides]